MRGILEVRDLDWEVTLFTINKNNLFLLSLTFR